jgi:hypothetical protein
VEKRLRGAKGSRFERRLALVESADDDLAKFRRRTGANPSELNATLELAEVAEHRNLYCPAYDKCLGLAVNLEWASFSCSQCEHRTAGVAPAVEDATPWGDDI